MKNDSQNFPARGRESPDKSAQSPWWRGFPRQPFVITSPFVTQKNKKFDALRQEDVIA